MSENNGDIYKYLKKFIIAKGAEFTHTSIGNPSQSYYIQSEDYDEFIKEYTKSINNGEKIHITEKHKTISPILLDFDFKFNSNKSNLTRFYTNETIKKIISTYTNVLNDYIDVDNYDVYVLEKKNPLLINDTTGKDGIHIVIPEVITQPNLQYIARNKCLELLKPIFEDLNYTNSVEDIFDECVIEKNNWLMYGSRKPDKEAYKVTHVFNVNQSNINEIKNNKKSKELIKLFSIRNKKKEINLKFEKILELQDYDNIMTEKEREVLTYKQIFKKTKNNKKNQNIDIDLIRKFVKILNPLRSDNFDSWIKLGWCLRNIDYRLLDEWVDFSKNSEKYTEGECEKKWEYMKESNLGIGTLRMWAKNDNSKEYIKIVQNDLQTLLVKAKSSTDTDISSVIYQMYKYEFVCSNIKSQVWWEFKDHRWKQSDSGYALKMKMSREVFKEFSRMAAEYSTKAVNTEDEEDQERFTKYAKNYNKIASDLKKTPKKSNLLKECCEFFYQEKFEEKLDSKCNLIGFNNGVYDLETYEFRDGQPDDYISFSTGIDYLEYKIDDPINLEIIEFIDQILPKKEMKIYLLKLFASFLSGNIKDEKFHIFTGTGANGKSKIIELFQNSFGDYCGQFNVTLLTQKRVKSNETNSELAQAKGKRFMVLQEPCEDEKINTGFMKELTGGDKIIARGLYKDPMEFKPQFSIVLTCNHLPNVPSDDGGTWRRLRVVQYGSKFIENPNPDNQNEFKIDTELSLKFDGWKENFMTILIDYYKKYMNEGIYEPEEVLICTKEYQKDNDIMKNYIDERISRNSNSFLSQNELYSDFKYWYKESGQKVKTTPTKNNISKYFIKLYGNYNGKSKVNGWTGYELNNMNIIDFNDDI
tara:strand:+ start:2336 stop:4939 length:2604 start_codon:yes stop_codon:yes gene_type:complete